VLRMDYFLRTNCLHLSVCRNDCSSNVQNKRREMPIEISRLCQCPQCKDTVRDTQRSQAVASSSVSEDDAKKLHHSDTHYKGHIETGFIAQLSSDSGLAKFCFRLLISIMRETYYA